MVNFLKPALVREMASSPTQQKTGYLFSKQICCWPVNFTSFPTCGTTATVWSRCPRSYWVIGHTSYHLITNLKQLSADYLSWMGDSFWTLDATEMGSNLITLQEVIGLNLICAQMDLFSAILRNMFVAKWIILKRDLLIDSAHNILINLNLIIKKNPFYYQKVKLNFYIFL